MQRSGRTILITGGTSGIGLEIASQLLAKRNTIVITGRDPGKLEKVQRKLPGINVFKADQSTAQGVRSLFDRVTSSFPALDMVFNNAGIMRKISLHDERIDLEDLTTEIDTNLSGLIRMTKQFLPDLKTKRTPQSSMYPRDWHSYPSRFRLSIAPPRRGFMRLPNA